MNIQRDRIVDENLKVSHLIATCSAIQLLIIYWFVLHNVDRISKTYTKRCGKVCVAVISIKFSEREMEAAFNL